MPSTPHPAEASAATSFAAPPSPVDALAAGANPVISVGIASADLMDLARDTQLLAAAGVRMLHFDVMDGHFVPQLTFGPSFVKGVRTRLLKDVHLMIDEPLETVDQYAAAGADLITVHVESSRHIHRVLQRLGELRNANDTERPILRGLAFNPSTPLTALEPLIDEVDFILLVAINPGFSPQSFIPRTFQRFARLREMIQPLGRRVLLGIDGGVNRKTIAEIARVRPDVVVSGSAMFEGGRGKIVENFEFFEHALAASY